MRIQTPASRRVRAALLAACVAVPVAAVVPAVPVAERVVLGSPPRQFDSRCFTGERPSAESPVRGTGTTRQRCPRLPGVLGVAHNAGDRPQTTRRALAHGAEVIEIDLVEVGGELRVGHDEPWPLLGEALFRGPTLAQAWRRSAPRGVLLDLKPTSIEVGHVVAFLRAHRRPDRPTFVTSRDLRLAARLAEQAPDNVTVLATVAFPEALQRLRTDPSAAGRIDGLSIHQGLVDAGTAQWADARGWFLLAWTVDRPARAQALVRVGVDAVVTEDLSLLRAMSGL